MTEYTIFDIETLKKISSSNPIPSLPFGLGVIYESKYDTYFKFEPNQIKDFITKLLSAKQLVSKNGLNFDFEVLKKYMTESQILAFQAIPHFDIDKFLREKTGEWVSLKNVGPYTIARYEWDTDKRKTWTMKSEDIPILISRALRLQAEKPELHRQLIDKAIEHCKKDVEVTKILYNLIHEKKPLYYWSKMSKVIKKVDTC